MTKKYSAAVLCTFVNAMAGWLVEQLGLGQLLPVVRGTGDTGDAVAVEGCAVG